MSLHAFLDVSCAIFVMLFCLHICFVSCRARIKWYRTENEKVKNTKETPKVICSPERHHATS